MAVPVSEETVRHTALLARIGATDEEIRALQKELGAILDFFRELEAYSPEEVAAAPESARRAGRFDLAEARLPADREALRRNFPVAQDGYLKVRSVF